ncbi:MAG: VWA domain-containing protein [Acidobacteriota bacterium]
MHGSYQILALCFGIGICSSDATARFQAPPPSPGTGSSRSQIVSLHVHFLDPAGRPVTDIRPEEIHIDEAGVEQSILRVMGPNEPFDVGMLLDVSPSVENHVDAIRNETSRFFHSIPETAQALILTFDSQVYVDCDWTTDRKKVDEAIFEFGLHKPGDTSVIYEALAVTLEQKYIERGPRQALILFSDGVEIGSHGVSEKESLKVARQAGILIFSLQYDSRDHYRRLYGGHNDDPRRIPAPPGSTGTSVGGIFVGTGRMSERDWAEYKVQKTFQRATQYMRNVATAGRGPYLAMFHATDLVPIYERILDEISGLYTLTFIPAKPRHDGRFHSVRVTTSRKNVVAKATTKVYWSK